MKNRIKITLYCLLAITIIAVIWLMFGSSKSILKNEENTPIITEEDTNKNIEENTFETDTFEEDVMKDLEGFFGNNNGYEDVEGEYGFTEPENE